MSKYENKPIYVFKGRKGNITLWIKRYIWHKWIPKTPKAYADAQVKSGWKTKEEAYGPCWWGMQEDPNETLELIGELK
jgi:hypothetical protein